MFHARFVLVLIILAGVLPWGLLPAQAQPVPGQFQRIRPMDATKVRPVPANRAPIMEKRDDEIIDFVNPQWKRVLVDAYWTMPGGTLLPIDVNRDGEITVAEAEAVTHRLVLTPDEPINGPMDDFRYFTNLSRLEIHQAELSQVDLPVMERLESFHLVHTQVTGTMSLVDQPQLEYSLVQWSTVEEVVLARLPTMRTMNTMDSSVTRLQVNDVPALRFLILDNANQPLTLALGDPVEVVRIANCDPLQTAGWPTGIVELKVENSRFDGMPPLPTSLQVLQLRDVPLAGDVSVSALRQLQGLWLVNVGLEELPTIPHSVTMLVLDDNQLSVLPALPQQLHTLWVRNNQLKAINHFPQSLARIDVSHNQLSTIPPTGPLLNLEVLNVGHNQIEALSDLSQNFALRYLSVNNNQLTQLNVSARQKLFDVDVSYNQLTTLPDFSINGWLNEISIGGNPLPTFPKLPRRVQVLDIAGGLPMVSEPFDLRAFHSLAQLDISHAGLTALPLLPDQITNADFSHNAVQLLAGLAQTSFRTLNLAHNQIDTIWDLPRAVEALNLANNNLSQAHDLVGQLAAMPFFYTEPMTFDLRNNQLPPETCTLLAQFSDRGISVELSPQQDGETPVCEAPEPVAFDDPILRANLARADLRDAEGFPIVFEDAANVPLKQALRVVSFKLGPEPAGEPGITDLTLLAHFPSLETVVINGHPLRDAEDLDALTNLRHLDLSFNDISFFGPLPDGLRYLKVRHNRIATLPTLPAALDELDAQSNRLVQLPTLPDGLRVLRVSGNRLTSLPALPNSMRAIYCHSNNLRVLPNLPAGMDILYAQHNQLGTVPSLPDTLRTVALDDNGLTALPEQLPSQLLRFCIADNDIAQLPPLPSGLRELDASNTGLEDATSLAAVIALKRVDLSGNRLRDLDTILGSFAISDQTDYVDLRGNFFTSEDCAGLQERALSGTTDFRYREQRDGVILDCGALGEEIQFNNAALEAFVAQQPTSDGGIVDRNGDGKITTVEAARLQHLTVTGADVPDLGDIKGIDQCVKLRTLTLTDQPNLIAIRPLARLGQLRELTIRRTRLQELDLLPHGLEILDAPDNQLRAWPSRPNTLHTVDLSKNYFQYVSSSVLPRLYLFDMSTNPLGGPPALRESPNLAYLNLDRTGIIRLPDVHHRVRPVRWSMQDNSINQLNRFLYNESILYSTDQELDLSGNPFDANDCDDLAELAARDGALILDATINDVCPDL